MYIDDPNDTTQSTYSDAEYDTPADADRGDTVVEDKPAPAADVKAVKDALQQDDTKEADDKAAADAAAEKAARDEKGRFVKKDTDEDEDEDEDDDKDEKDEKDDQNLVIRLNKMREQRDRERAERQRLEEELRTKTAPPKADEKDPVAEINAELEKLYEDVEELRAEAKTKDAAAVQRKIDALNRQLVTIENEKVTAKTVSTASVNQTYNNMIAHLEATVPMFTPGSSEYSEEMVEALEFQVKAYEAVGMPATTALRRAVLILTRSDPFAPAPKKQEVAAPAKKEEPAPAKKKTDVAAAVKTIKQTPPDASDKGSNVEDKKIDIKALDDEEFDKLPESKKRQLRGDLG
jgi:hypothetical protein